MAEIEEKAGKGKKKRSNKMSTRVDMTPMVDLAFLLITFFMLTTSLTKSHALKLKMPAKAEKHEKIKVAESEALTVILGESDKIYYYNGFKNPRVITTSFSADGIRKVLSDQTKSVPDLVVIIKATKESRYKNLVDILDEIKITSAPKYVYSAITDIDLELVEKAKFN